MAGYSANADHLCGSRPVPDPTDQVTEEAVPSWSFIQGQHICCPSSRWESGEYVSPGLEGRKPQVPTASSLVEAEVS